MAAVIVPRDQLQIPEHLRGRLERPSLRLVAPEGSERPTVVSLRGPHQPANVPPATPATRRQASVAGLVVAACMVVVALTGLTALAVGRPPAGPPAVVVDAAPVVPASVVSGGVWVVQPGDSLWSIAAAVAPGADLRPVVDELARRAGGGALQPGQRIELEGLLR